MSHSFVIDLTTYLIHGIGKIDPSESCCDGMRVQISTCSSVVGCFPSSSR